VINMQDRTLTCRDCNQEFTFTVGEQEFFAQKGFTNEPSRCPELPRFPARREAGRILLGRLLQRRRVRSSRARDVPAVCATCGKDTQCPSSHGRQAGVTARTASLPSDRPPPVTVAAAAVTRAAGLFSALRCPIRGGHLATPYLCPGHAPGPRPAAQTKARIASLTPGASLM